MKLQKSLMVAGSIEISNFDLVKDLKEVIHYLALSS